MNQREKFKRNIIELIHGVTYDEAIEKERQQCWEKDVEHADKYGLLEFVSSEVFPITLSRVMQALDNIDTTIFFNNGKIGRLETVFKKRMTLPTVEFICSWKLTNKDGSTATDEDQSDECIEQLNKLFE